jgi:hypothetical protein
MMQIGAASITSCCTPLNKGACKIARVPKQGLKSRNRDGRLIAKSADFAIPLQSQEVLQSTFVSALRHAEGIAEQH